MSQQTSDQTLYPKLDSSIPPLDESEKYVRLINSEKELVSKLREQVETGNPLDHVGDINVLPAELFATKSKVSTSRIDPLKRLADLPTEEQEVEEEPEDEENEDEEVVEDEEDDAGGDYIVSHFDNGEGFEDNDEDGDGDDMI